MRGGVEFSITFICSMNDFAKQKTLKNFLILGILVGAFFEAQAQEVLTKINGVHDGKHQNIMREFIQEMEPHHLM